MVLGERSGVKFIVCNRVIERTVYSGIWRAWEEFCGFKEAVFGGVSIVGRSVGRFREEEEVVSEFLGVRLSGFI